MQQLEIKSCAKINLTLDVLSKRHDGYHNVRMIMQTLDLCDTIRLAKADSDIEIKTNLVYLPTDERNIAFKAARLFLEHNGIKSGIMIDIDKKIPVAAGLAGGSGNAAAVLVGLNRLFGNPLNRSKLLEMGLKLGADVPYCMMGGTMLAEGVGDRLTPLADMPDCFVVLVKPPFSVSTAEVFGKLAGQQIKEHPDTKGCIQALDNNDFKGVAIRLYNVLEAVTTVKYPVIEEIKSRLLSDGAVGACMSGSGPTVFGLFDNEEMAQRAFDIQKKNFDDVFMCRPVNLEWGLG